MFLESSHLEEFLTVDSWLTHLHEFFEDIRSLADLFF